MIQDLPSRPTEIPGVAEGAELPHAPAVTPAPAVDHDGGRAGLGPSPIRLPLEIGADEDRTEEGDGQDDPTDRSGLDRPVRDRSGLDRLGGRSSSMTSGVGLMG